MTDRPDGVLVWCEPCHAMRRTPHTCRVEALQARIRELTAALEDALDDMEPSGLLSYRRGREVLHGE